MSIKFFPCQGDKEITLANGAAISTYGGEGGVLTAPFRLQGVGCLTHCHHVSVELLEFSSAKARLATSASLNGYFFPFISWCDSWPFPAIRTTSPFFAPWIARKMARLRSSST